MARARLLAIVRTYAERAVLIAVPLVSGACGSAATGPASRVMHPSGDSLSWLSLDGAPYGVSVSPGGTFYVTQVQARAVMRGTVTDDDQHFSGSLAVGDLPWNVALNPAGTMAFVANYGGNSVSVVDVSGDSIVATVPLPAGATNVLFSPDGRQAFVSTTGDHLYFMDPGNPQTPTSVLVGPTVKGLAFAVGPQLLYAASEAAASVMVIDPNAHTVLRTYAVSQSPEGIAVSTDGSKVYIASNITGLEVLDTATGDRTPVPGVGPGAEDVALTPDGEQLYVSFPYPGLVQVIDCRSLAVVRTVMQGSAPHGIAFDATGGTAVIADDMGRVYFVR
jgi:YVTN family beta-propeller protein